MSYARTGGLFWGVVGERNQVLASQVPSSPSWVPAAQEKRVLQGIQGLRLEDTPHRDLLHEGGTAPDGARGAQRHRREAEAGQGSIRGHGARAANVALQRQVAEAFAEEAERKILYAQKIKDFIQAGTE